MRSLLNTTKSSRKRRHISIKSSRKRRRISAKSSRKTRRISVFQRLPYGTNPPANGDSKPIQSANARRRDSTSNQMFLVRYVRNGNLDHAVITTENNKNNSFRLVPDDDDDLPHNLLSLIRVENYVRLYEFSRYPVIGSCDSYIWVLGQNRHPYDLVWDMAASRLVGCYPSAVPTMSDLWLSGFGFDPLSGDYKAVRCWMDEDEDFFAIKELYAEVLSLRTGSWKAIPYPYDSNVITESSLSICVNGFYYWLVKALRAGGGFAIMSFDFSNEMFCADLIRLPKEEKTKKLLRVAVVEFHGSLAVICCDSESEEDDCLTFEIWAWKNEGNWFLASTFDMPAAAAPRLVLGLYKNENLFFQDSKGNLMLYDCATRDLENLGIHAVERVAYVFPYIKSSVGPVTGD